MTRSPVDNRLPVVVLISGGGTNLQAIIDRTTDGLPITIEVVISNRADAGGLARAKRAGIPTRIIDHTGFASRASFDAALTSTIDAYSPGLVVLAGFMRILTAGFVRHYQGRLLNIHPSLLPKFQGLNTHRRAIEAGETEHGASVHFVTGEVDGGPVFLQARVPLSADDNASTLAARVLQREHVIYPRVIEWYAQGRVRLVDREVWFDGVPLPRALDLDEMEHAR